MSDIDKFKELKENCFGGIHKLLIEDNKFETILPCGCILVKDYGVPKSVEFCKKHLNKEL